LPSGKNDLRGSHPEPRLSDVAIRLTPVPAAAAGSSRIFRRLRGRELQYGTRSGHILRHNDFVGEKGLATSSVCLTETRQRLQRYPVGTATRRARSQIFSPLVFRPWRFGDGGQQRGAGPSDLSFRKIQRGTVPRCLFLENRSGPRASSLAFEGNTNLRENREAL
jgi:hypothetical protein